MTLPTSGCLPLRFLFVRKDESLLVSWSQLTTVAGVGGEGEVHYGVDGLVVEVTYPLRGWLASGGITHWWEGWLTSRGGWLTSWESHTLVRK